MSRIMHNSGEKFVSEKTPSGKSQPYFCKIFTPAPVGVPDCCFGGAQTRPTRHGTGGSVRKPWGGRVVSWVD